MNPHSGAESTIRGLLTMVALDANPDAAAVARSVTGMAAHHGLTTVNAEEPRFSSGARVVQPDGGAWTGEGNLLGAGYLEVPPGEWVELDLDLAGETMVSPIVCRRAEDAGVSRWSVVGGRALGTLPGGGTGAQGLTEAPGALVPLPLDRPVGPGRACPAEAGAVAGGDAASVDNCLRVLGTVTMLGPMKVLTWGAAPHEGRAALRPDGQWQLRLPGDEASWPSLLAVLPAEITVAVLTLREGQGANTLSALGFVADRTEQLWQVPVAGLGRGIVSPAHTLAPVTECNLAGVAELDNAVRFQIPGAERWVGTVSDLEESLADDEFDPELYLVAIHRDTGCYDGLIRVWNRVPSPRLGCVGVRPPWRRTRLGPALLSAVAGTLRQRRVTQVVTETDVANRDSHSIAEHHGGIRCGRTVEWVLQADRRR